MSTGSKEMVRVEKMSTKITVGMLMAATLVLSVACSDSQELRNLEDRVSELESQVTDAQYEVETLQRKNADLESQIEDVQNMADEAQSTAEEAKTAAEEASSCVGELASGLESLTLDDLRYGFGVSVSCP